MICLRGNQDHRPELNTNLLGQASGQLEPARVCEIDVEQQHVGTEYFDTTDGLVRRVCDADHRCALPLQEVPGSVQEGRTVVDDRTPQHGSSIIESPRAEMAASRNLVGRRRTTTQILWSASSHGRWKVEQLTQSFEIERSVGAGAELLDPDRRLMHHLPKDAVNGL
jgi:hypothetical protein